MSVLEPWVVSFGLLQPYRWCDGILINTPGAALISAIYNVQAEAVQVAVHHVASLCQRRHQRRVDGGIVMTMKDRAALVTMYLNWQAIDVQCQLIRALAVEFNADRSLDSDCFRNALIFIENSIYCYRFRPAS